MSWGALGTLTGRLQLASVTSGLLTLLKHVDRIRRNATQAGASMKTSAGRTSGRSLYGANAWKPMRAILD